MGTRSITRVVDESGSVILAMYRLFDGYVEGGHGDDLNNFLKDIKVVNGLPLNAYDKFANGMGCLAAQLVTHFKTEQGPGGIYIYPTDCADEEFNYEVSLVDGVLNLSVRGEDEDDDVRLLLPEVPKDVKIVEFLYPSGNGGGYSENVWRKVQVSEQDENYITGIDLLDNNKFKRFLLNRVVGGASKVFTVTSK